MKTQISYSEVFNKHNNINHPENSKRTDVMVQAIRNTSFFDEMDIISPEKIAEDILYEIHSEKVIDKIKEMSHYSELWIDPDTYVSSSDYDIARLAAGSVLNIAKNVISSKARNGFALVRPPGHHATKNHSMGFCLFNNISLAAHALTNSGKKVLIFDHDVHHGNGTQDIFYKRDDVMFQSFHLSPHYPGTGSISESGEDGGKGFTVNAPIKYGNGNDSISQLIDEIFLPIGRQFKPDIILVSAGFDSHHADTLGGLRLTSNFFGEIIEKLQGLQKKIVLTLEGGYNLQWIGKCLVSELEQLTNNEISFRESIDDISDIKDVLKSLKDEMGKYWKI